MYIEYPKELQSKISPLYKNNYNRAFATTYIYLSTLGLLLLLEPHM